MSLKRIEMARLKRKEKGIAFRRPRRRINFENEKTHYGEECQRPDMPADDYDIGKNIFLQNLQEQVNVGILLNTKAICQNLKRVTKV